LGADREGDQVNKLVEIRDLISERMEAGATLEQMELVIDSSGLEEDAKSALWLFAWSYLPGRSQAVAASKMLAETYDVPGPVNDSLQTSADKLSGVMEAVREHEDRTRSRAVRRRPADDRLYRRVREALTNR
jgi:hypothetical protein